MGQVVSLLVKLTIISWFFYSNFVQENLSNWMMFLKSALIQSLNQCLKDVLMLFQSLSSAKNILKNVGNQTCHCKLSKNTEVFLKIPQFYVSQKKVSLDRLGMSLNKWLHHFHLRANYPFKTVILTNPPSKIWMSVVLRIPCSFTS